MAGGDDEAYRRWGQLTFGQLQDALRRLELLMEGTKPELVKRLVEFERITLQRVAQASDAGTQEDDDSSVESVSDGESSGEESYEIDIESCDEDEEIDDRTELVTSLLEIQPSNRTASAQASFDAEIIEIKEESESDTDYECEALKHENETVHEMEVDSQRENQSDQEFNDVKMDDEEFEDVPLDQETKTSTLATTPSAQAARALTPTARPTVANRILAQTRTPPVLASRAVPTTPPSSELSSSGERSEQSFPSIRSPMPSTSQRIVRPSTIGTNTNTSRSSSLLSNASIPMHMPNSHQAQLQPTSSHHVAMVTTASTSSTVGLQFSVGPRASEFDGPDGMPSMKDAVKMCKEAMASSRLCLRLKSAQTLALSGLLDFLSRAVYSSLTFGSDGSGFAVLDFATTTRHKSTENDIKRIKTRGLDIIENMEDARRQIKEVCREGEHLTVMNADGTNDTEFAQKLVYVSSVPDAVTECTLASHFFRATHVCLQQARGGLKSGLVVCRTREDVTMYTQMPTVFISGHTISVCDFWDKRRPVEEREKAAREVLVNSVCNREFGHVTTLEERRLLVDGLIEYRARMEEKNELRRTATSQAIDRHKECQLIENILDHHTRYMLERGETPPERDLNRMTRKYQKLNGYPVPNTGMNARPPVRLRGNRQPSYENRAPKQVGIDCRAMGSKRVQSITRAENRHIAAPAKSQPITPANTQPVTPATIRAVSAPAKATDSPKTVQYRSAYEDHLQRLKASKAAGNSEPSAYEKHLQRLKGPNAVANRERTVGANPANERAVAKSEPNVGVNPANKRALDPEGGGDQAKRSKLGTQIMPKVNRKGLPVIRQKEFKAKMPLETLKTIRKIENRLQRDLRKAKLEGKDPFNPTESVSSPSIPPDPSTASNSNITTGDIPADRSTRTSVEAEAHVTSGRKVLIDRKTGQSLVQTKGEIRRNVTTVPSLPSAMQQEATTSKPIMPPTNQAQNLLNQGQRQGQYNIKDQSCAKPYEMNSVLHKGTTAPSISSGETSEVFRKIQERMYRELTQGATPVINRCLEKIHTQKDSINVPQTVTSAFDEPIIQYLSDQNQSLDSNLYVEPIGSRPGSNFRQFQGNSSHNTNQVKQSQEISSNLSQQNQCEQGLKTPLLPLPSQGTRASLVTSQTGTRTLLAAPQQATRGLLATPRQEGNSPNSRFQHPDTVSGRFILPPPSGSSHPGSQPWSY